ncbi:FecR domain-containing protein [Rhodopirellula sallentina]|uniref:FecR protein domain protein n=1 Tax=Rhodopirellula sallentina SM41 TaxID=1263870 RepID=M5U7Q0_9BACT|nr:FecR domain-containing protein [Rhodopirellula sallentina]EMI57497.1 FecR protein domain protein [Rhodopirellula sallentina SM41]
MKTPRWESLLSRAQDGELSAEEKRELERLLREDEASLDQYLDAMALDALSQEHHDEESIAKPLAHVANQATETRAWRTAVLAIAASLVFVAGWWSLQTSDSPSSSRAERVVTGPRVVLAKGQNAEFEMPSGVQVRLRGPAAYQTLGDNQLSLTSGLLTANVPPQATGFRVVTPNGDVVDHGTEIGVMVDELQTELHVFEGQAEVVLPLDGVSSMVGASKAVRVNHPNNAGYEPISIQPSLFGKPAKAASSRIRFDFDSNDEAWTQTQTGVFADRGDQPTSNLTAGQSRYETLVGFVKLPAAEDKVESFHDNPLQFAPQSGEGRVLPLPFHFRDSMSSLRLTSPPFRLNSNDGPITAFITGGRGHAETPPDFVHELPDQADGEGFLGLALRRVRDGRYLCSVRRRPGNFYEWAPVEISQSTLAAATRNDPADEVYVLDLIDTYQDPRWSWIGLDTVSIPGRLVPGRLVPGRLVPDRLVEEQ